MDRKPQGRFNMGKTHMDAIECISLIRDNAVCLFSLEAGKDTTMDSEDLFKTIVVGPDGIGRPGTFNPFGPIVSDQIVSERTRAMDQVISKKDVPDWAQFQVSLTNHPIIKDEHGVYRYQANPLTTYLQGHVDLNVMWLLYHRNAAWSRDQFMQFYRDIGYSLAGFEEVWSEELNAMEGKDA